MLFSLLLSCVLSFFYKYVTFSVQFSSSVVPDSLQPHGLQHAKLPCPLPTPRACSNSWPLSWWCHSAVWSFVVPFSSCLQSFPASEFISYMICLLHKSCLQWKHYYVSTGSVLTCPALQRQCVTVQCKIDVEGKETPLVTYLLISIVNQIFNSVQLLSPVWLFVTPRTEAHQASLSIANSQSLLKLMSIESVMPSNHLILCLPFFSCLKSFPASGSFQMSQLFPSSGQSIGVSASALVLPMNIQDWFPSGLTGLIFLLSKGLSRVFSNTTVQKHKFFGAQLFL